MTIPYTYLLKHKPSGRVYYGCRYAKGCSPSDLWNTYFTSSKHIKKLVEETGKESFSYEIRKTFSNIDECRIWENRVLKRMNVTRRHIFINKTDNISIAVERQSLGGKKHFEKDPEFYRKSGYELGKRNLGRKHTAETNLKQSLLRKGIKQGKRNKPESDQAKLNKSLGHIGKSSGMLGKTFAPCSCLLCGHLTKPPNLKAHYKYNHTDIIYNQL